MIYEAAKQNGELIRIDQVKRFPTVDRPDKTITYPFLAWGLKTYKTYYESFFSMFEKNNDDTFYIELMKRLFEVQTIDDLRKLNKFMTDRYDSLRGMRMKYFYPDMIFQTDETKSYYTELFVDEANGLNRLVKRIISEYSKRVLKRKLDVSNFESGEALIEEKRRIKRNILNGVDSLSYISTERLDMADAPDNLKDVIRYYVEKYISISLGRNPEHLCFDCPVAMEKCEKMQFYKKKLSEYPFIIDGIQKGHTEKRMMDDGEIDEVFIPDTFEVYRCSLYEAEKNRKKVRVRAK